MSPGRLLVVGSGAREHALAWRLARDPGSPAVLVAPGNPGMGVDFERLPLDGSDPSALAAVCRARGVELVVIGPEAPLAAGLADALAAEGIPVFGASAAAARLESSKWFAKEIMGEAGVPTARAEIHATHESARAALDRFAPPWVIKADGLAAGKGVRVTREREEAERFLDACLLEGRFGDGGRRVVIEEFLDGDEATLMAVCDGSRFVLLPSARDHKRAFDGDTGPNTGGMGALAPHPAVNPGLEAEVGTRIVGPVLAAMRARGTPFRGLLYCGLMIGAAGAGVVEFNCRFGDPETQAVLPLVSGSLGRLLASAASGALDDRAIARLPGAAVSVVLADAGYPGTGSGTARIAGLDGLEAGILRFHAATVREGECWRVSGGRACSLAAVGPDLESARASVYAAVDRLGGEGWRCRRDIAARLEGART